MANDAVVSLAPPGAGRSLDWWMDETAAAGNTWRLRNGTTLAWAAQAGSPTGIGPSDSGTWINGPANFRMAQLTSWGIQLIGRMGFRETKPAVRFTWPLARMLFEGMFSWPAVPPAGTTSGMFLTGKYRSGGFNQPLSTGDDGAGFFNDNGTLVFYTRRGAAFERVDVSAYAGPLNGLNKLALVARQATYDAEASLQAWVNDRLALTRSWGAGTNLPAIGTDTNGTANGCLVPMIVHGPNTTYINIAQVHIAHAPDAGPV